MNRGRPPRGTVGAAWALVTVALATFAYALPRLGAVPARSATSTSSAMGAGEGGGPTHPDAHLVTIENRAPAWATARDGGPDSQAGKRQIPAPFGALAAISLAVLVAFALVRLIRQHKTWPAQLCVPCGVRAPPALRIA